MYELVLYASDQSAPFVCIHSSCCGRCVAQPATMPSIRDLLPSSVYTGACSPSTPAMAASSAPRFMVPAPAEKKIEMYSPVGWEIYTANASWTLAEMLRLQGCTITTLSHCA